MVFVRLVTTKIINRRCNGKSNLRFYGADVSLCRFHDAPDPIFNGPLSDKSPIFSSVSPCVWLCRRRQLFPWRVYFFHDSRKRGRRMAGGVLWKFLINVLARVSPWRHIASWRPLFEFFRLLLFRWLILLYARRRWTYAVKMQFVFSRVTLFALYTV